MTVKITPDLLADLRQKAENCQPPVWKLDEHSDVISDAHTVAECGFAEDAILIATADPATVLALVAEIENLTRTAQELFDKTKSLEYEIEVKRYVELHEKTQNIAHENEAKRFYGANAKKVQVLKGEHPLEVAIEMICKNNAKNHSKPPKESEAGR